MEYTKETDINIARKRVMATSPLYGEIVVLGLKLDDAEPFALYGNEKEILMDFWKIIKDFNGYK